jgi:xylulokinase
MEPVDYLTMRFSGVASATHASRTVMWMTDNRHLDRFSYDESLLRIVGLNAQKLPPLVPFGSIVGTITSNVAATLGLSPDTVVVTGVPDLHAAALGSGATNMYDTHLALSTSSWISCPVPQKKTDVAHSIAAVPGLTNDSYVIVNNQETGAKALEWLRSVVAGSGSTMNYTDLAALAATSPVGANGVSFTPWLAGERSPADDRLVRAGFQNLSITSSTADLARAVFEGVALNSAWLFDYVEKFAGRRLNPIRLLGGGAQSPLWCQIYADVLDRQVEQVRQPMVAQLRGVAHLAAIARGQYGVRDVSARTRSGSIYEPDSSASERYQLLRTALKGHYKAERRWSRGIGKSLR